MIREQEESTRKMTLFEIGDELNAIAIAFDKAEESGDDADVTAAFEAYFGSLLDDRDRKFDGYAALMAWNQHLADSADAEAKRCAELAKVRKNRVVALKDRLKYYMELNSITKLETPKHVFTVCKNSQKSLVIEEGVTPDQVSEGFRKVTVDFDRAEIRSAIEGGQDVQFAKLEQGTHLRVK